MDKQIVEYLQNGIQLNSKKKLLLHMQQHKRPYYMKL